MSDTIYTRFICDSPENNQTCANPLCNKLTNNPKYCSLSCGTSHRNKLTQFKKEQEYLQNPKHCLKCDKVLSYESRKNKFCCQSCATSYNNKFKIKKPATDEFRQKMRDIYLSKNYGICTSAMQCKVCSKFFFNKTVKQTCSDECKSILIGKRLKNYIKTNPFHKFNRSPIKRSWMETSFENWISTYGFKYGLSGYLIEVKFWNPETKKNGRADFVFPRLKLIIELDGTHYIQRKELDAIRDAYLSSRGWTVFRIGYVEYKKKTKINDVKKLLQIK